MSGPCIISFIEKRVDNGSASTWAFQSCRPINTSWPFCSRDHPSNRAAPAAAHPQLNGFNENGFDDKAAKQCPARAEVFRAPPAVAATLSLTYLNEAISKTTCPVRFKVNKAITTTSSLLYKFFLYTAADDTHFRYWNLKKGRIF